MAATIFRYDNAGNVYGTLSYDSATHDEALDGTDKLTVVSVASPTKRDRLVWQDDGGTWHEHMVDATKRTHGSNGARTESTCSNSVNELFGVIASGTKLRASVQSIMSTLLTGTRWTAGTCSNFGIVEIEVYHKSVRECIAELCELAHGELETSITVSGSGVTSRTVRIVRERGRKSVRRQFQYGRNVKSILREVAADEVYTAVKGYGAKLDKDDDAEYPSRLEVQVASNMDLARWGVPVGNGTYAHNITTYTDAQCTDKTFLMKQCKSVLDSVSKPLVRYEFDTADVGGGLWSDVRLGDKTLCVDELFNPPLELIERVSQIKRNLKGRTQCRIAIGARVNPLVEQFKAAEKTSKKSTGNSTRVSSQMPTTTLGAGYDGEDAADFGDAVNPTVTEPSSIAIVTPPTKMEYYDGERIDFSGIEVSLHNSDSSAYTDDWHPDGMASFDELSFPVQNASKNSGLDDDYAITDVFGFDVAYGGLDTPNTNWSGGVASGNWAFCDMYKDTSDLEYYHYYTPKDPNAVIVATAADSSANPSFIIRAFDQDGESVGFYFLNGRYGQESLDEKSSISTRADLMYYSDSYVTEGLVFSGRYKTTFNKGDESQDVANLASIPVHWTRSDGATLEASFNVTVSATNHGSWSGGEGDDPSSSGGGKF